MNSVASVVRASDGSAVPKVQVPLVEDCGTVHVSNTIPVAASVYTTAVLDCALIGLRSNISVRNLKMGSLGREPAYKA